MSDHYIKFPWLTHESRSSEAKSATSGTSTPPSSEVSAQSTVVPSASNADDEPSSSPSTVLTSAEKIANAREKIASDLKNWQDKFAQAADKGTEDLEERVKEITDRQISDRVNGVGRALIIQLEEASTSQIAKLKSTIVKIVKSVPEDADKETIANGEEEISQAVKKAGLVIKDKAQALRKWKQEYVVETASLVSAASQSTLDVLDNISSLGLQEIGMRWAWMDGVTYKDWSKYHEVKTNFDKWTSEVEAVAKQHPGLEKAQGAGDEIEAYGMTVAEDTATKLRQLKEIGIWKVQALDDSEDFSRRQIPPEAAKAGRKVADKVQSASEQIVGTSQETSQSMTSKIKEGVADIASSASSRIVGYEPGIAEKAGSKFYEASSAASESVAGVTGSDANGIVSSLKDKATGIAEPASKSLSSVSSAILDTPSSSSDGVASGASSASSSASSAANQASKKVFAGAMAQKVGEQKPILDDLVDEDATYSEKLQSIVEQAGDKYAEITNAVNEAIFKPTSTQGSAESLTSLASDQYSSALAAASRALYGTEQGAGESVASVASGKYAEAVAA